MSSCHIHWPDVVRPALQCYRALDLGLHDCGVKCAPRRFTPQTRHLSASLPPGAALSLRGKYSAHARGRGGRVAGHTPRDSLRAPTHPHIAYPPATPDWADPTLGPQRGGRGGVESPSRPPRRPTSSRLESRAGGLPEPRTP